MIFNARRNTYTPCYFITKITSANYFIHVRATTSLLYTICLHILVSSISSFINVVFYSSSISLHRPISDGHRITDPIYPLIRFASRWEPHLTIITLLRVVAFSFLRFILTFRSKRCLGVVRDRFAAMHQRS